MIIVRTPLRLELLGGGTDIEYFYRQYIGRVLNATLNKYIYLPMQPLFSGRIRVVYSQVENVDAVEKIQNTRVKAALQHLGVPSGIEIFSMADIPAGSGLGSSSSFTVGLVHGLYHYLGRRITPEALAETACVLEIEKLGEPIGKQDQYSAAFGGLNFMKFHNDGRVEVQPLYLEPSIKNELERHLMFFYTGKAHSASEILKEQKGDLERKIPILKQMSDLVPLAIKKLEAGNLADFARILEEEWLLKRNLADNIITPEIDTMYKAAKGAGALGGRVSGAGGGGFLFLIVEPEKHDEVREALKNYQEVPMRLIEGGSQIVYRD